MWYEKQFVWIVIGGALVAMLISVLIGIAQSVWFDEAYSIALAKRPVGELLYLTSIDTHPPLYYLLLKVWAGVFGWSEFALRSLSVLAMGGAVIVGAYLVKRLFGVKAALMTLLFLVFAPFLLRYGFEIRMYSLASLIGVSATYVLVCATEVKDRTRKIWLYAAYAVLVAVGVFTLYYTVLLWITHVIWFWLSLRRKEPVFKQPWWLAYAGSVLLFLPWLPTFVKQISNGALAPISQQLTVDNMVGIVSFWFFSQPSWFLNGLSSLVILAIIVMLGYVIVNAWKLVPNKDKPSYILLVLYAGMPVLVIALISLARPMYVERYLAHVLIGFALLLGVSLWMLWQKKSKVACRIVITLFVALVIGVGYLASSGNYNYQRMQVPEVREVAKSIACDKKSPILANDPYVAIELSYYMTRCDVYFYSDTADLRGGYAPLANSPFRVADPMEAFREAKYVTYVYYDKPSLKLPDSLMRTKDISFGPMHISVFTAE
jgi:mannosyltransferase